MKRAGHSNLALHRSKERPGNLSIGNSDSMDAGAAEISDSLTGTLTQAKSSSFPQIFRPCALGLVALAIAVFLWGFSYKLSLYNRSSNPTARASVAKLWIEPRSNVTAAAANKRLALPPGPDFLAASVPGEVSAPRCAIIRPTAAGVCGFASWAYLLPLRSPPQAFSYQT